MAKPNLNRPIARLWVLLAWFLAGAGTAYAATDVFYGGFAFAGRAVDQKTQYRYTYQLSQKKEADGTGYLDVTFRNFFRGNAEALKKTNLHFDLAKPGDAKTVLAFAFTGERVSIEEIGANYKVCINLTGQILILDYADMTVRAAYPQIWEVIHVFKHEPADPDITALLTGDQFGYRSEFFQKPLAACLSQVVLGKKSSRTVRVLRVDVEDEALPFLPERCREAPAAYAAWAAEQYGAFLSTELDLALLPYAKDATNAKMALRFSNTEMLQFTIPEPTYAFDLTIRKFKKVEAKRTRAEVLLVYGSYITVRFYEPEFDRVYFNEKLKIGLPKTVPVSQKDIDDCAAFQEALKNVLLESTQKMTADKKTRKILAKCKRS